MINPEFEKIILSYMYSDAPIIYLLINGYNQTLIETNHHTEKLLEEELTGQAVNKVIETFGKPIDFLALAQNPKELYRYSVSQASGQPQTYYFNFFPGQNPGEVIALGKTNFQEIQQLQDNLLSMNQQLNNLSREMQKKNIELKQLNEVKNQFLGIAAHDLRNPLGVIYSYSDFMLEYPEDLNDEQIEILTSIQKASTFMLNLLNDLLDISKIESGKLNLDYKEVDYVALIKQNIAMNQVIASRKQIKIVFSHAEMIPPITVDSRKIEQVLNNLLSNAIKFSHSDTIITVTVFKSNKDVIVSVQDQGQGIPKTEQQNLFKPFSTTSVKSTGKEKSTGLGLNIVQKIILGHRGKIWLESETGQGCTFYFSIPLYSQD